MITRKIKEAYKLRSDSMKMKTIWAALWTFSGKGAGGIIRLLSNLILTRLLYPEAFGLIATASVFLSMVQIFSDTGVKTAIIQNPKGADTHFINTSWMIGILRSVFLFVLVVSMIKPMSNFYGQPELEALILIMSFSLLVEGLMNPALPLLIKRLDMQKHVIYEISTQFLGFIITILLVYQLRTVFAIAIGNLLTSILRLIGSYLVMKYRPAFQWDKTAAKELFHFGKFIFINSMITWAALNSDRLLIGKVLDMESLGFYNLGLYIGVFITQLLVQVFAQSYFPAVSSVSNDMERVKRIFNQTSLLTISTVVPGMVIIALFSQEIVGFLYDPRYQLAAIALFWISLKGLFSSISTIQSMTIIALGRPFYETIAMGVGLVCMLILIPLGAEIGGLSGVCVGIFLSTMAISLVETILMIRKLNFSAMIVIKPFIQMIFITGLMMLIYYLLRPFLYTELSFNFIFIATMSVIGFAISACQYYVLKKRIKILPVEVGELKKGFSC